MTGPRSSLLSDGPLSGKVALVTGAANGIGQQVALRLASAGAKLLLVDRDADGLEATRGMVTAAGGTAFVHLADLAQREQAAGCVDAGVSRFDAVDILVNAAGITGPNGGLLDAGEDGWTWSSRSTSPRHTSS